MLYAQDSVYVGLYTYLFTVQYSKLLNLQYRL